MANPKIPKPVDPTQANREMLAGLLRKGVPDGSPLGQSLAATDIEDSAVQDAENAQYEMPADIKDHAYNLFPSLNEIAPRSNTQIPLAPEEPIREPAEFDIPEDQNYLNDLDTFEEEAVANENQQPKAQLDREPAGLEAPTEAPQDDIAAMVQASSQNKRNAELSAQMAKTRDAVIGAGLGTKFEADNSIYKDMAANADEPIKKFLLASELKNTKAKNDPNSQISKLVRKSLTTMGMNMSGLDGVSYAQIEKIYPSLAQALYTKFANEAKSDERNLLAGIKADTRNMAKQEREDKEFQKFGEKINEDLLGPRSGTGKEVLRKNQADHALKLLEGFENLNDVPSMQKRELAVALATMISPGLPHESTIAELDPTTLNQKIKEYVTKITGKPYGAGAGGVVDMLKDSVLRQRQVSAQIINRHRVKAEAGFAHLKLKNPTKYDQVRNQVYSAGIEFEDAADAEMAKHLPKAKEKTPKLNPMERLDELERKHAEGQARIEQLKMKQGN